MKSCFAPEVEGLGQALAVPLSWGSKNKNNISEWNQKPVKDDVFVCEWMYVQLIIVSHSNTITSLLLGMVMYRVL